MFEIILITLCVVAANRFHKAGEKGVGKYIAGVWLSLLGCLFVGGFLSAATETMAVMVIFGICGYVAAFAIVFSALKTGKGYLEYHEKKNATNQTISQKEGE